MIVFCPHLFVVIPVELILCSFRKRAVVSNSSSVSGLVSGRPALLRHSTLPTVSKYRSRNTKDLFSDVFSVFLPISQPFVGRSLYLSRVLIRRTPVTPCQINASPDDESLDIHLFLLQSLGSILFLQGCNNLTTRRDPVQSVSPTT